MENPNPPSVSVFLDSTLGTHFAMLVPSNETIATLKRKVEKEHAATFPNFGEVVVRAIKVWRGEHMYHLSDFMDVSSAFDGAEEGRFFHIELVPAKEKMKIVKFGVISEKEKSNDKLGVDYCSNEKEAIELLSSLQRGISGVRSDHIHPKRILPSENLSLTPFKTQKEKLGSTDLAVDRVKTGQGFESNNKKKARKGSENGEEVSQDKNNVTDGSEKKRSKKTKGNSSVMTGAAPPVRENEPESREEIVHKSDLVLEKGMNIGLVENPGDATLVASNRVNQTEGLPTEKLSSALPELDKQRQNIETIGSNNQPNCATQEQADPIIVEIKKERSRKGSSNSNKKDVSEETGHITVTSSENKKKRKKTKGCSSEMPTVGQLVRENESQIREDRENEGDFALRTEGFEKQTKGNSGVTESPGDATFVTSGHTDQTEGLPVQSFGSTPADHDKEKQYEGTVESHSQPSTDPTGEATLVASNGVNQTEGLPTEKLNSALPNLDKQRQNIETIGSNNQPDCATQEQADPIIAETKKERSRKGSSNSNKKDVSQETGDTTIVTSLENKKKRQKTKVSSSEMPTVGPFISREDRENERDFALRTEGVEKQSEGNSGITEDLGDATFITSDHTNQTEGLPVQLLRSTPADLDKEKQYKGTVESQSQPSTDLTFDQEKRNLIFESKVEKPRKVSGNKTEVSQEKKKRKKATKVPSSEMPPEVPPVREIEPPVREDAVEHGSNLDLQSGLPKNPGDLAIAVSNPMNKTNSLPIGTLDSTLPEPNTETKQTETNENVETNNEPDSKLVIDQGKTDHGAEVHANPITESANLVESKNEKSRKGGGKKTEVSQQTTDKMDGGSVVSTNEKKKRKKTKVLSPEVPAVVPSLREIESQIKENVSQLENKLTQVEPAVLENQFSDEKRKKRRKQEGIEETQASKLENSIKDGNKQSEAGPTISSPRKEKQKKENNGGSINTQETLSKSSHSLSDNSKVDESVAFHDLNTEKINFMDHFVLKNTGETADVAKPPSDKKKSRTKSNLQPIDPPIDPLNAKNVQPIPTNQDGTGTGTITLVDPSKEKPSKKPSTRKQPKERSNPVPSQTSLDFMSPQNQKGENVSKPKSQIKTKDQSSQDMGVEKRAVNPVKSLIADMAASSDSTDEDTPEQARRYKVAVRKIPSKKMGNVVNAPKKNSNSIFNDSASEESSGDKTVILQKKPVARMVPEGSSMSADVSGEFDDVESKKNENTSAGSDKKGKGSSGDGVNFSQPPKGPKKFVNLGSILRSSSSYKKAKLTVSQSQADDPEIVFESQLE